MRLLLSILGLTFSLGCSTSKDLGEAIATDSFTSDDGVKIAYDVHGAGPTVLLIHGITGSKNDFTPLAKELSAAGLRAVVFDARGHGASGKPHSPDAYGEQLVTDICNLLDHLSVESAHVIGYSMGGDIANKFREMYPNRLRSCVVGGAGMGVSKGWADSPHDFSQIADSLASGDGWRPLLRLPGAISPGVASEDEIAAANKPMTDGQDTDALSALCRRYETLEIDRQKLESNTIRTLIVVGAEDAEYESSIELNAELSNSKLHIIDGVNHFEAWTNKEFNDVVTAFVIDNKNPK